jgi:dTDP-4-dehydrorhamnose reductase
VILLFGGNGQLGRELTALAQARGVPLRALAHSEADIAEPEAVAAAIAAASPAIVVNAAAYTRVDEAETEIAAAARSNATGPAVLAEACARTRLPLVHVSTDYVFDGTKAGAYVESDPVAPLSAYGRTKADGEAAIRARHREHLILRTSWVYGVFGRNMLKTALRLARERDELRFVADQRGCPTSTADLAEAILCAAAPRLVAGEPVSGTYHFAGTGATTWYDFVRHVVAVQAEFTGRRPRVVPITTAEYPTPARRPANSELDSSAFAATFGYRAEPWRFRVESAVRALVENPAEIAA